MRFARHPVLSLGHYSLKEVRGGSVTRLPNHVPPYTLLWIRGGTTIGPVSDLATPEVGMPHRKDAACSFHDMLVESDSSRICLLRLIMARVRYERSRGLRGRGCRDRHPVRDGTHCDNALDGLRPTMLVLPQCLLQSW